MRMHSAAEVQTAMKPMAITHRAIITSGIVMPATADA